TQDATDLLLTVSTGRGASAAADYAAGKTITLPDARGRSFFGPDSMGSTAAGRLGSGVGTFLTNNDKLGAGAGSETKVLVTANLPAYTPTGTITNGAITFPNSQVTSLANGANGGITTGPSSANVSLTAVLGPTQATTTFAGVAQGGLSTGFDKTPPAILFTPYMKL